LGTWPAFNLLPAPFFGFTANPFAGFAVKGPGRAYLKPGRDSLRTVAALGADDGAAAKRVLKAFTPRFSVSGYRASLDRLFSTLEYPGEAL
jgi:hypothetical protein